MKKKKKSKVLKGVEIKCCNFARTSYAELKASDSIDKLIVFKIYFLPKYWYSMFD